MMPAFWQDIMTQAEKLTVELMPLLLHKILASLVVVVICVVLIRGLTRLRKRSFEKPVGSISPEKMNTAKSMTYSVLKNLVYFFGFCLILQIFNVPVTSLLAVAGVGSVAIGLAAQSLIKDIINGAFILMEGVYAVGDIVQVGAYGGTVLALGMRTTKIQGADGAVHIIPNSQVVTVTNLSKGQQRVVVDIPLVYHCTLEKVMDVIKNETQSISMPEVILTGPEALGIVEIKENGAVFRIVADCATGENEAAAREIRRRMLLRLEKEGIIRKD